MKLWYLGRQTEINMVFNLPTKRRLQLALVFLIIGILVSGYLINHHYQILNGEASFHSFCSINTTFNCDLVNTSKYSEIMGIPLATWALSYFVLLFSVIIAVLIETVSLSAAFGFLLPFCTIGLGAALSALFVSAILLKTFCLMCSALQFTVLSSSLLLWLAFFSNGKLVSFRPKTVGTIVLFGVFLLGLTSMLSKSLAKPIPIDEQAFVTIFRGQAELPIETGPSPKLGFQGENPPLQLIEFSDFQCPYCRMAAKQMHRLLTQYSDKIQFVFKAFPLDPSCNPHVTRQVHTAACSAAKAALCADEQKKFVPMYETLFERQEEITNEVVDAWALEIGLDTAEFKKCMTSQRVQDRILEDVNLGNVLGIQSTPTFFVNGRKVEGVIDEARLRLLMQELGVH